MNYCEETVIAGIFRANLIVNSKKTALEFYKGVCSVILIPMNKGKTLFLRIEPGNHISTITKDERRKGAWFVPSILDEDGSIAFKYRKFINQYLRKD